MVVAPSDDLLIRWAAEETPREGDGRLPMVEFLHVRGGGDEAETARVEARRLEALVRQAETSTAGVVRANRVRLRRLMQDTAAARPEIAFRGTDVI